MTTTGISRLRDWCAARGPFVLTCVALATAVAACGSNANVPGDDSDHIASHRDVDGPIGPGVRSPTR